MKKTTRSGMDIKHRRSPKSKQIIAQWEAIKTDPIRAEWDEWTAGKARCPHCLDMDEDEWETMCDCFLYEVWKESEVDIYIAGAD